jgi:hypothetical protein
MIAHKVLSDVLGLSLVALAIGDQCLCKISALVRAKPMAKSTTSVRNRPSESVNISGSLTLSGILICAMGTAIGLLKKIARNTDLRG